MVISKAAQACQMWPSCSYKPLSFQTLRHSQFLSNFQSPKFKFSFSGKKNVCLFEVLTKTSLSSDKNVPLPPSLIPRYYPDRYSFLVTCIWTIDTSWISQQADQEWDKKWSSRADTNTYHKDSGFFLTRTFYSSVLLLHNKGSLTCWINRTCFFWKCAQICGLSNYSYLSNKRTCPLINFQKKFQPARCF